MLLALFITERTVINQARQQEKIQQAHGVGIDSKWHKRIDIDAPDLDIFDAATRQGNDGRFTCLCHALGPYGAVVLVFDLEQRGIQLRALAVIHRLEIGVRRVGRQDGLAERADILLDIVIANSHPGLRITGVSKISHAQACCMGEIKAVVIIAHRLEVMAFVSLDKTGANRG